MTERQVIMAQNVLVISLRLNNALTLGYPMAYGEKDPRSQLVVAWSGELHPSLGCPTHSCCPEMATEGRSQARERCKRTCLHLAPASPEQEPLWAGIWTGVGRGAGCSLCAWGLSCCSPSPLEERGSGPGTNLLLQPGSGPQTPAGLWRVHPSTL